MVTYCVDVHVVRILAEKRDKSGSKAAVKLREQGRVPGVLFSGEDELNKMLLSFPTKDVVNLHNKIGTYGWACQVFDVEVGDRTYRALVSVFVCFCAHVCVYTRSCRCLLACVRVQCNRNTRIAFS